MSGRVGVVAFILTVSAVCAVDEDEMKISAKDGDERDAQLSIDDDSCDR